MPVVETVSGSSDDEGTRAAARLLYQFDLEYDEPAPAPDQLAPRLAGLIADGHVQVLLGRAQEVYRAELYVVPSRREL